MRESTLALGSPCVLLCSSKWCMEHAVGDGHCSLLGDQLEEASGPEPIVLPLNVSLFIECFGRGLPWNPSHRLAEMLEFSLYEKDDLEEIFAKLSYFGQLALATLLFGLSVPHDLQYVVSDPVFYGRGVEEAMPEAHDKLAFLWRETEVCHGLRDRYGFNVPHAPHAPHADVMDLDPPEVRSFFFFPSII